MDKIAFIFPGQGAQFVGMGKDFFDLFPSAKHVFQEADEVLSSYFSKLIFDGPSEELTLTKNSQLAIYIASIAIWRTVQEQLPEIQPSVCAGLSLGEYTALTAAKKITFDECLRLVQARGEYMHAASLSNPGTMQVVLGLSPEDVEQALLGIRDVSIANLNCPGQVVIAGKETALKEASIPLKEKGAKRVLPLDVSGAFHSALMQEAQDNLKPHLDHAILMESDIAFVSNVLGDYVRTSEEIRACLLKQVTQPVLWERDILATQREGVNIYYEMGPGKTLAGMNKKIGISAPTFSIGKVADLEELANAIVKG
ncbi:MAG: ACP S-malonyltransferase [Chlamydiota bacterium]